METNKNIEKIFDPNEYLPRNQQEARKKWNQIDREHKKTAEFRRRRNRRVRQQLKKKGRI